MKSNCFHHENWSAIVFMALQEDESRSLLTLSYLTPRSPLGWGIGIHPNCTSHLIIRMLLLQYPQFIAYLETDITFSTSKAVLNLRGKHKQCLAVHFQLIPLAWECPCIINNIRSHRPLQKYSSRWTRLSSGFLTYVTSVYIPSNSYRTWRMNKELLSKELYLTWMATSHFLPRDIELLTPAGCHLSYWNKDAINRKLL